MILRLVAATQLAAAGARGAATSSQPARRAYLSVQSTMVGTNKTSVSTWSYEIDLT